MEAVEIITVQTGTELITLIPESRDEIILKLILFNLAVSK
jgi:hypothetical protein